MLSLERSQSLGFPLVRLHGRLDQVTFPLLLHELASLAPTQTVGLDLTEVVAIDTAGAVLLATAWEWLERYGGQLRLVGCSPAAHRGLVEELGPRHSFLRHWPMN